VGRCFWNNRVYGLGFRFEGLRFRFRFGFAYVLFSRSARGQVCLGLKGLRFRLEG